MAVLIRRSHKVSQKEHTPEASPVKLSGVSDGEMCGHAWDCGWYQVRMSLADQHRAGDELQRVKSLHAVLGKKLLPQIYELGFLPSPGEFFGDGGD